LGAKKRKIIEKNRKVRKGKIKKNKRKNVMKKEGGK